MDVSSISSRESLGAARPATRPPKQSSFKIYGAFLSCRLLGIVSSSTLDMPRKRYSKEQKVYQQYMEDQEKHEKNEQKVSSSVPPTATRCTRFSFSTQKFTERLREGAKEIFNIRQRLRRHRYAVKPGSPPPRQPPCCPHWDKERPKKTSKSQQKKKSGSYESLRVYKPGQMSRRERCEARLRDPTSKEARRKAACEQARRSSTATNYASSGRSEEVDAEMEMWRQRVRDIDRRNKVLVESLGVKTSRARKEQPDKLWGEGRRGKCSSIERMSGRGRSLGTLVLTGTN